MKAVFANGYREKHASYWQGFCKIAAGQQTAPNRFGIGKPNWQPPNRFGAPVSPSTPVTPKATLPTAPKSKLTGALKYGGLGLFTLGAPFFVPHLAKAINPDQTAQQITKSQQRSLGNNIQGQPTIRLPGQQPNKSDYAAQARLNDLLYKLRSKYENLQ